MKKRAQALGAVPYAAGSADHLWSFAHVDDLADLYVLALEAGGLVGSSMPARRAVCVQKPLPMPLASAWGWTAKSLNLVRRSLEKRLAP